MSSAVRGKALASQVHLIPWDGQNEQQYQRMYDQRVECGWKCEQVETWKQMMLDGTKTFYWVTLADNAEDREELLKRHMDNYPKERGFLTDTASKVHNVARQPTNASFLPLGHLALDLMPDRDVSYGLPKSTWWVTCVFLSPRIQSRGLGLASMARIEQIASAEPLNATMLALDVVTGDFQASEEVLQAFYDRVNLPRPKIPFSNEAWYRKQGYTTTFTARDEDRYVWTNPSTGVAKKVPLVILAKPLTLTE